MLIRAVQALQMVEVGGTGQAGGPQEIIKFVF
jgi:hypothetical protein